MSEEQILEQEFAYFFENPKQMGDNSDSHPLYQILINNNIPMDEGLIYSSKFPCEFCQKSHKDNCSFNFKDTATMSQVLQKIERDRDFELVV